MTTDFGGWTTRRHALSIVAIVAAVSMLSSAQLEAHGVSSKDARFLLSLDGAAPVALMYLGAKHMVTGYDHLLFLVGVVFFLYRLKDIVLYVSLFTIGHSVTLLGGARIRLKAEHALEPADVLEALVDDR